MKELLKKIKFSFEVNIAIKEIVSVKNKVTGEKLDSDLTLEKQKNLYDNSIIVVKLANP
jgi:hypothetical protein